MDLTILILTAVGLSFDCFAISVIYGTYTVERKFIQAVKLSFIFGVFHVLMPYIGYLAGSSVKIYIESFDHWITFLILIYIGIKMIIEDIKERKNKNEKTEISLKIKVLFYLAIATSVDALAVGISFSFVDLPIYQTVAFIGISAFLFTFFGVGFGDMISKKIHIRFQLIGGIILICIGLKILIEHLYLHYSI